jgi:hypothetical protein
MPAEHALKMGLNPTFGQLTKLPTLAAQLSADPVPSGPLNANYPILASMLAEERKEAEYARYKCAQAERQARDASGNATRYAAELHMVRMEIEALKANTAKEKERADEWEERCHMWEQQFGHMVSENGEDFLA